MISKLVCDLCIWCRYCYEYSRSNSINVFYYAVFVQDTTIFFQFEDLVQLFDTFCSRSCLWTMSSDNIRDQSCIVRHSSHLYHCLCTIFECTKHLRTHFTTSSLFKNCIRITIVVDLVILSFTHNFYVQAHCFSEAIQMHNCTRLISIRSCVDNAFFFCKFLQVWSNNNICLNIQHYNMLFISHSISSYFSSNIRYTSCINHTFNKVSLRYEISILTSNIFTSFHSCISFL